MKAKNCHDNFRYYHGCSLVKLGEIIGLVVAGGLGTDNFGDAVEFLPLGENILGKQFYFLELTMVRGKASFFQIS